MNDLKPRIIQQRKFFSTSDGKTEDLIEFLDHFLLEGFVDYELEVANEFNDSHYAQVVVIKSRTETQQEVVQRLNREDSMREARQKLYLELKAEFDPN